MDPSLLVVYGLLIVMVNLLFIIGWLIFIPMFSLLYGRVVTFSSVTLPGIGVLTRLIYNGLIIASIKVWR